MGGPPAADFRGRPARVSHLPRCDAPRRLHHATVGDRPDPHPPSHPRGTPGPRRRAEPPIDAGPREPRGVTRPMPARRRPDRPVSTPPRRPATPRGRSVRAAVPPQRPHGPHRLPAGPGSPVRTAGRTAREAHRRGGGRAEARSPLLARQRPRAYVPATPIEFPIRTGVRRKRGTVREGGPIRFVLRRSNCIVEEGRREGDAVDGSLVSR